MVGNSKPRQRKYSKQHEEIAEACRTAWTFTEIEAKLGVTSPNNSLRRYIKFTKIPMPAYRGKAVATEKMVAANKRGCRRKIHLSDLRSDTLIERSTARRVLLTEGGREEKCEICGWAERRLSDQITPVHLHHDNGDVFDNRPENLQFLCPNCHSLTENYSGKNKKNRARTSSEIEKTEWLKSNRRKEQKHKPLASCKRQGCDKKCLGSFCSGACQSFASRRVERPTSNILMLDILRMSFLQIGKKYRVSDVAVRKWAKAYNLPHTFATVRRLREEAGVKVTPAGALLYEDW